MARRFAGFSIRHKVIAGFAVMLCCMAGLGLIAIHRLAAVGALAADIRGHQLPSTQLLGDVAFQTERYRMLEASFALTADPAARARDAVAMAMAADQAEAVFRAYRPLAGPELESRLADYTWERWQNYLGLHERFAAIAQTGDDTALAHLYRGEMNAAFDSFQDALRPLIDFNVDEARTATDASASVAASAQAWIRGLIVSMSLLCIGVGWTLIQGVSTPITRITDAMRRLARRDLDVVIPGLGRRDEIGAIAQALQVFRDGLVEATRLSAERETARTKELHRMRQFADSTFEGISIHRDGVVLDVNVPFCEMLGYKHPAELRGRRVLDLTAPSSLELVSDRLARKAHESSVIDLQHVDGHVIPVEVLARPFDYDGTEATLSAMRDLSERRAAEEKIRKLAFHDALTGLPNRHLLNDRLAQALELCGRNCSRLAVLYLGLDRFKFVNDMFGHAAGDRLLVEVADRLSATARAADTVSRLGGDEFIVVQALADQPKQAAILARRLIEALSAPFRIEGQPVEIGVSIGIATYPDDGSTTTTLLKNSDTAMSRAKTGGRGQYQFFAPTMDLQLRERLALEKDLRQALARNELEVYFQPIFDCAERALAGFESLVRWTHPVRGPVSPTEFIPIAEESGLILPLGRWVLEAACAEAASWPGPWTVAVNLSPIQFREAGLAELIAKTVRNTGLAPGRLELEVTEGVFINDPDEALATLLRLRAEGVRISLDDFGTGYSSLSYLRRFPFDKLKIDRSFIQDFESNPDASAIVAAIVTMGHCLNIRVVAEGVENEAQLELLTSHRCHQVQGYLLGRPIPSRDLAAWLAARGFQAASAPTAAQVAG